MNVNTVQNNSKRINVGDVVLLRQETRRAPFKVISIEGKTCTIQSLSVMNVKKPITHRLVKFSLLRHPTEEERVEIEADINSVYSESA